MNNINKLEFPSYEHIKSLNLGKGDDINEYKFCIFDIHGATYVRFSLNEDGNGKLYVDLVTDGYTNSEDSKLFKLTKADYAKACRYCQELYEGIVSNILASNTLHKDAWC